MDVVVVRYLIALVFLYLMTIGALSFGYSISKQKFQDFVVVRFYALLCVLLFGYFYLGDIFQDYRNNQLDYWNASKLYSYMNIISAMSVFYSSLINSYETVKFLKQVPFFETIKMFEISRKVIKSAVTIFLLKAVVFPLTIQATMIMREKQSEAYVNVWSSFYAIIPNIVAISIPNCFFGALVISKEMVGVLNERLLNIILEANLLQHDLQMKLQSSYYRMQKFCDLSDKMDMLAQRYSIISRYTQWYLKLNSLPYVCSLLSNLFGITAGLFSQYNSLADTFINEEPYDAFNAISQSVFFLISMGDLTLQANISSNNLMTLAETGEILQKVKLQNADVRFKQTVEAFSLQIFVAKYKIMPMGLLEVNMSLVHDVLATVTSFLLILIQTDLTLRFSLK